MPMPDLRQCPALEPAPVVDLSPAALDALEDYARGHYTVSSATALALAAAVRGLRSDLSAVLLHNVGGDDMAGYHLVGVWTSRTPYESRSEAEAAYLDFARRRAAGEGGDVR
jgi:hypothetical protein